MPSKALLRSGETLSEADRARLLAASRVEWTIDFPKVSERVLWMARNLDDSRPAAAMEANGAMLVRGEGRLTDLRTVAVGNDQLVARRAVVIANGSTAAIPPIAGLDTVDFWTNRQAAIPRELPVSLAILGGGAIGVELGQAFARLGCRVTIVEAGPTFLGLEEPEAGAALRPHLEADGMSCRERRSGTLMMVYSTPALKSHFVWWKLIGTMMTLVPSRERCLLSPVA